MHGQFDLLTLSFTLEYTRFQFQRQRNISLASYYKSTFKDCQRTGKTVTGVGRTVYCW